ncbi:AAA family ATPase [Halomonas sp. M1]|uniref:phage NrS-1 polymerase family protein n=1 Tax=Halomonas sp. M1 TaxID=3035470 RepID=UPI0024860942|nr:AAA family ATPase [Halomonas sp. M1]WFE71218.1 AAA family ATPase [Halomonas sp. M1]
MSSPTDQKKTQTEQLGEKSAHPQAARNPSQHPSSTATGNAAPAAPQPARWVNIPQELKRAKQWCIAGSDKAPYGVGKDGTLVNISVHDHHKFMEFEDAVKTAAAHDAGIGFILTEQDPYTCIDIDYKDARNEDNPAKHTTPEQLERFNKIIEAFDSYTELSQGGLGRHVWCKGGRGAGVRRDGVEVYSKERFIVCTGNVMNDRPLEERGELVAQLVSEIERTRGAKLDPASMEEMPEDYDDSEILERARNAGNSDKFNDLYEGNWDSYIEYPSQSEADLSLMSMFAFYSRSNEQCRRLFRGSALGQRDKASRNDRYLNRTLSIVRTRQQEEDDPNKDYHIKHGEQVAAVLLEAFNRRQEEQRVNEKAQAKSRIKVSSAAELVKRPPVRWRIHGILPEEGFAALYGPPACGKSFLTLDMLAHIAAGQPWFGHKVRQTPVAYVAFEGGHGVPQRVSAFQKAHWMPDQLSFIEAPTISLIEPADRDALIEVLQQHLLTGGVLCIDTLAASAPGIDENSSEGMGKLISELQTIQHEVGGCILVVHHTGKDRERGLRGWSGLQGALDAAIEVARDSSGVRSWKLTKAKDGQDGCGESFTLKQVLIDHNEDGDPITSCVVALAAQYNANDHSVRVAEENDFVCEWVRKEVEAGKFPSGRSLERQRDQMKPQIQLTQKQLRDAIARLVTEGRLQEEKENGKPWLSAVERMRAR